MIYKKTQIGFFSIAVLGAVLIMMLGIYLSGTIQESELWIFKLTITFIALMFVLFSSLTVKVTRQELIWYFGPGLWKYRIKTGEIQAVGSTRSHPIEGVGIRWNPWKGMLYNVSGLNAVKVIRKNGKSTRIGTNEPQKLIEVIKEAANLPESSVLK